jgi:hypothetical protein
MEYVQGDSNITVTDLCVNKPQSVPVLFEPPFTLKWTTYYQITRRDIQEDGILPLRS